MDLVYANVGNDVATAAGSCSSTALVAAEHYQNAVLRTMVRRLKVHLGLALIVTSHLLNNFASHIMNNTIVSSSSVRFLQWPQNTCRQQFEAYLLTVYLHYLRMYT